MTDPKDLMTDSYDYSLPESQIATYPAKPADMAKLLVYDRKTDSITHTHFRNLLDFLPKNSAIFYNDTRVIPARIFGHKSSGGKIELLLNKPLPNNRYLVMIRGRVHKGSHLIFEQDLEAKVVELLEDGARIVSFVKDNKELEFNTLIEILEEIGHVPLPPYLNREDETEDRDNYQTLFAKESGAVAAPTASLHFTPKLLDKIQQKHPSYTLTLHVGAGTFKPVESKEILKHPMHSEYFKIPKDALEYLKSDAPLVAVGTTVTRTIEYFIRTGSSEGECDLFIHPANPPLRVNHLLTNFHLPKSTLIMLVSAFVGREKTLELYNIAIKEGYRFYSYGDAMLII